MGMGRTRRKTYRMRIGRTRAVHFRAQSVTESNRNKQRVRSASDQGRHAQGFAFRQITVCTYTYFFRRDRTFVVACCQNSEHGDWRSYVLLAVAQSRGHRIGESLERTRGGALRDSYLSTRISAQSTVSTYSRVLIKRRREREITRVTPLCQHPKDTARGIRRD